MKNSKTWNLNLLLSLSFVWLSTYGSFAQSAEKPTSIPSRNQFIQQIAPYIDGREEMKEVARTSPDYYRWLNTIALEQITPQWLQTAQLSKAIPSDWVQFWQSGRVENSIDLMTEYVLYQEQINPVLGFMHKDSVALLLTLANTDTVVFLIKKLIKQEPEGMKLLHLHRLYKEPNREPTFDLLFEYEELKMKYQEFQSRIIPSTITGEYISKTGHSKWHTSVAAVLNRYTLLVLNREWVVKHRVRGGPTYRILAWEKKTGQVGYFVVQIVGSPGVIWQLRLFEPQKKGYRIIGEKKMKDSYKYQRLAKKILYYLAIVLGGGSAMVLVIFYFVQRRRKYQQLRTQMALSGLRAQLNPHFLFNTLTSIQDLVNQENKSAANRYFNEMAQLLRYVVDGSAEEYTSLAAELAALEKYCSLEALRTPFNYHFDIRPEIDLQNIEIPTMLLQPFVENAILHGLRPSSIPKDLQISIWPEGEYRIGISIIDNGIGIDAGEANLQHNTLKRSHQGINTTRKRIELLNIGKKQKITLTIADRSQLKAKQKGTLVQLSIPI